MGTFDPQVLSAAVQAIGGIITGILGTLAAVWTRARKRQQADQRCERICANMVGAMEAMLTAMEALGGANPALTNAIVRVRVEISHARQYLDGDSQQGGS